MGINLVPSFLKYLNFIVNYKCNSMKLSELRQQLLFKFIRLQNRIFKGVKRQVIMIELVLYNIYYL